MLPCHVCVISAVFQQMPLMAVETTHLGLRDQLIFPEIDYDKIDKLRGMEVTIVTSAKTDDQARALLQLLGMPFKKEA